MNRRDLLKLGALSCVPVCGGCYNEARFFGAIRSASFVPRFEKLFPRLVGAGDGKAFLWTFLEKALGAAIEPHYQGNVGSDEGEGDCVAQAYGMAVDILTATEIFMGNEPEVWLAKSSVEMIYAGSRVEIGENKLRGKAGSLGDWGARCLKEIGVLHRVKYDSVDLTGYNPGRSRKYRDVGIPDELEPIAKQHPVKVFTKVGTYKGTRDALSAGQPVVICSSYAPVVDSNGTAHRAEDGSIRLETGCSCGRPWCRNGRKKWYHAWCAIGHDDDGLYIINSHGKNWIDGPRPNGLPEGAFKLSQSDASLLIGDWGEAYAISAYVGHPGKKRIDTIRKHKLYL